MEQKWNNSMRGQFGKKLYYEMKDNDKIFLIVGDLGYKLFDAHFESYPERTINTGAAEQAMMDIAVGLALEGKIPVVYSITPFLLWRAAETIRTYINHENIPVKLIGGGRGEDYTIHDGFSHDAKDDIQFMEPFENIKCFWPETNEELDELLPRALTDPVPYYINLRR